MQFLPSCSSKREKGQALLMVLLSMSVVLTVVLSVASRSITDIQIESYEEDAYRAFSAAEAGIEESLLKGSNVEGSFGGVSYDADISQNSPGSFFNYPIGLSSGEVATFWFVSHNQDDLNSFHCTDDEDCTRASQLEICWGDGSIITPSEEPAIILSIYYDDSDPLQVVGFNNYSEVKVFSRAYDPESASRATPNNFDLVSNVSCSFDSGIYSYSKKIVLPAEMKSSCATSQLGCLLVAKIKMVYNSVPQPVGIQVKGGNAILPSQGLLISSTGEVGEVKRRVNVIQGYPAPPNLLESVLFSNTDIIK